MNISPQNVIGKCSYKCQLSFNYPVSSCAATNNGTYLTLSYMDSTASVSFNNAKYNIQACYLYSPSLQLYNNKNADGELMLVHQPISGGKTLYICIPLSTNGLSGAASNKISEIVDAVSKGAPSQGGNTSQGISDFTLNDFIPLKEFYSYSTSDEDVVSFGMQNSIYISQTTLTSLQKIITPFNGNAFPSGPSLFLNSKGPTKGTPATSDEIYIDCQPTNSSEEETNEVIDFKTKSNTVYDINTIFSNPIFLLFLFSFIFIVLIMLIYKGLNYLSEGSSYSFSGLTKKS
jgi:carbonic anhydrase